METWDIQQYHLETHNLFYSALFGERDTGLVDIGYRVVGEFSELEDRRNDTRVQPSYTVFNGETVVFFDFLEPGYITNEEIQRIANYNRVGLEAVQNHLRKLDMSEPDLDYKDVEKFDHCVICRSEQLAQQRSGSAEKRKYLDQLKQESDVAYVEAGGVLTLTEANGSIRAGDMNNLLEEGIRVPEKVSHTINLPRSIKNECLAIAICEEIVLGSDLRGGGIELDYADIGNYFGRAITYDKLDDVFEFLRSIGACRKRDGRFAFTKYTLPQVMAARSKLENTTVQTYLSEAAGTSDQRSLDEYGDEEG